MKRLSVLRFERRALVLLSAVGLLSGNSAADRACGGDKTPGIPEAAQTTPAAESGAPAPAEAAGEQPVAHNLLSEAEVVADQWVFVSGQKHGRLEETWLVREVDGQSVLICLGQPYGYLRTRRAFDNFRFSVEWKYPRDDNGNSGILVYTAGEDKVWPTSIQVQLHRPVAGSIFPSGDARTDNEIRDVRDAARPANQWNRCFITSMDGTLSVEINGRKVGEVTGCDPRRGAIALQSEGSEIHFRNIHITEIGKRPTASAQCGPIPHPCADVLVVPSFVMAGKRAFVSPEPPRWRHRRRHRMRLSHVVYRDSLAADVDLYHARDRVWIAVDSHFPDRISRRRDADGRGCGNDLAR